MNLEPKKPIQCTICGDKAIGPHRERHRLADENTNLRVENARLARLVVSLGGTI